MKLLKRILGIVSPSELREAKYKSALTACYYVLARVMEVFNE